MKNFVLIVALILVSCSAKKTTVSSTHKEKIQKGIPFNVIKEGTNSGFKTFGKWYVAKESALPLVWDSIYANYMKKDPLPKIDFENNEVYVITMGEQTSGGYNIKVESVVETKKEVVVNIIESKPGKTCVTTSVMTYPYQLFTIPKTKKSLRFNWVEKVYECK